MPAVLKPTIIPLHQASRLKKSQCDRLPIALDTTELRSISYYRDVYDLLSQIEESILSDAREVVDKRLLQGDELNFSQHMGYIAELAKNSRPYLAALLGPHGDPAFATRLKQALRPLVARFLTNDPALNPKEKDLLDEFYLAGMLAAITRWLDECDDMPIEALIQLISKHVL